MDSGPEPAPPDPDASDVTIKTSQMGNDVTINVEEPVEVVVEEEENSPVLTPNRCRNEPSTQEGGFPDEEDPAHEEISADIEKINPAFEETSPTMAGTPEIVCTVAHCNKPIDSKMIACNNCDKFTHFSCTQLPPTNYPCL